MSATATNSGFHSTIYDCHPDKLNLLSRQCLGSEFPIHVQQQGGCYKLHGVQAGGIEEASAVLLRCDAHQHIC